MRRSVIPVPPLAFASLEPRGKHKPMSSFSAYNAGKQAGYDRMRSSSYDMAHKLEACHFGVAVILKTWKRNLTANSSEDNKGKKDKRGEELLKRD
jgi:hypothetical protein